MPAVTTTDVAPPIAEYYDRALLVRAKPFLVYAMFGQKKRLRQGYGDTLHFRRYNRLVSEPVPLAEGTPPTGKIPTVTDIYQDVEWYGDYIAMTDKLLLTSIDPVLLEFTRLLGEQAGEIMDKVVRNGILGGTSFYRLSDDVGGLSTSGARSTVIGRINAPALDTVIRDMNEDMARPFTRVMRPGTGVGSSSVAPSFWGIVGPYVEKDLKTRVDGFVRAENYSGMQAYPNEIGSYDQIRFLRTNQDKVWINAGGLIPSSAIKSTGGTNADVYNIIITAQDGYGVCELDGMAMKHYAKQLGSAGALDPLSQLASSGWKAAGASVILNDDWVRRIEVAVSA